MRFISKTIGPALGVGVILTSFLLVFGNPVTRLTVQPQTPVVTVPSQTLTVPKPTITPTPTPTPKPKPTEPPTQAPGTYTLAQISSHNSATSCYSAINSSVYDLTSWVNKHPGGKAAILMICGKDGSNLFNMQHGGENRPEQILATYKIGALKN